MQLSFSKEPKFSHGILVGTCKKLEWMLPWWWYNYRQYNSYPISFIDFGMSERAHNWCLERGHYISCLRENFVIPDEGIDPLILEKWQSIMQGDLSEIRKVWFKKPLALLKTPFKHSLWIDIDCEVKGALQPIFETHFSEEKIVCALEPEKVTLDRRKKGLLEDNEALINSGVLGFNHGSSIIQEWASLSYFSNYQFIGDQDALSRAIYNKKGSISLLPKEYNLSFIEEEESIITHWLGSMGKRHILKIVENSLPLPFMNLKELL